MKKWTMAVMLALAGTAEAQDAILLPDNTIDYVPEHERVGSLYPLGYTSNPWFPVLEVDGLYIRDFIAPEMFTQDVMDTYIDEAPCLDGELYRSLDGDHVYLSCGKGDE